MSSEQIISHKVNIVAKIAGRCLLETIWAIGASAAAGALSA